MELLNIEDIIIKDRYRQECDSTQVAALADSIINTRLIQPIAVAEIDGKYYLEAGERRIRALETLAILQDTYKFGDEEIPTTKVPAIITKNPDTIARLQVEYDENVQRENFSWEDKARLSKQLVMLTQKRLERQREAEGKVAHPIGEKINPEAIDLEAYKQAALQVSPNPTSYTTRKLQEDVALATALEDAETRKELKSAKNSTEAKKRLKKIQQRKIDEALAVEVGKSFNAKKHTVLQGDCLQHMAKMDEKTFDLCITDPPYGIDAHKFGDSGGLVVNEHTYDDSYELWLENMPKWLRAINRVLKDNAFIYLACDVERFFDIKRFVEELHLGWQVQRKPLIHAKSFGRVPIPDFSYRYTYECWFYARKGKKATKAIMDDVFHTKSAKGEHGAAKDATAYNIFFRVSADAGDKIIDPFAGEGSCLIPAHHATCIYTGIEIDPRSYGKLVKRLKSLQGLKDTE